VQGKRIALVTGANQGVGRQVAKELVVNGLTVLVGSRNFERGEIAATEMWPDRYLYALGKRDDTMVIGKAERYTPFLSLSSSEMFPTGARAKTE
jgi:NAD(P)-dependent dehydrogenase (short-subunit alcohol dehydrogenase family)